MPRGKTTKRPPTIQERAREDDPIMTGEPTPAETTSTGDPLVVDMKDVKLAEQIVQGQAQLAPLLTLHLKRDGNEITDAGGTVHIPAPAMLPDGARVRVLIFREE